MSLESIRKKNIERNKELLKELDLDVLSSSLSNEFKPKSKPRQDPQLKVNKPIPTRRSKRLSKDPEDEKERIILEENAAKELSAQQELNDFRLERLRGDFNLKDILADPKLGNLLAEEAILTPQDLKDRKISIKFESPEFAENVNDGLAKLSVAAMKSDNRMEQADLKPNNSNPATDLSNCKLYANTDPSKIKLTAHRITSLLLHSSTSSRLAFAGDTNGSLGIWMIDEKSADGDPTIIFVKPHGRTISKITDLADSLTHVATCSYDGSCRILDLTKQTNTESIFIADKEGNHIGISDMNCPSPNMLYVTTLSGQFLRHDMRQNPKDIKFTDLLRLHDKKIGGFCVNPKSENYVATSSLDRTMKIWDLRSNSKQNSQSDIADGLLSPQNCGEFSARLSISTVDWNANQRLVCNGYDDNIRIFDLSSETLLGFGPKKRQGSRQPIRVQPLKAQYQLRHNCQTGRWVSILKSRWQRSPTDQVQKFVIGNMNRTIDVYGEDGHRIANLAAPEVMTAVPAVVAIHPTQNWVIGGTSSGKVFLFS